MNNEPISDTWQRGSPYERYIGRWSRQIAPRFLDWLDAPADLRWADVGCGTGALSAAILGQAAPRHVVGIEPSDGFRELAGRQLAGRARLLAGSASALPLDDSCCDAVVSGLVLNFVPDLPAALAEMVRVTAPGGCIAAYVWDYDDGMAVIKAFWDDAVALDADIAPQHEGTRFPLCRPGALQAAFESAGLQGVATGALELTARFSDFDDYWSPFLGGQGPAPAYVMSLTGPRREALRARLQARLAPAGGGPIALSARAWAVRGQRARV